MATLELERFPHVGQEIFEYCDTPTVLKFRKVSETWKEIAEKVLVKRWRNDWRDIAETDLQSDFEALKLRILDSNYGSYRGGSYYKNEIEYSNLESLLEYPNANNIQDIIRMMRQANSSQLKNNPLLYACDYGKLQVVKLLLDYSRITDDIDLNVKIDLDSFLPGCTAFMLACKNGNVDVVKLLLDQSKTYNIALNTWSGRGTALTWACSRSNDEVDPTKVVELLLNHPNGEEIDFNEKDKDGYTALILACRKVHFDVVKLLLDHSVVKNIDLTIGDKLGWNAFMWSCSILSYQRRGKIFRLFLDHPAMKNFDFTQRSNFGETPLMLACANGCEQVVRLLLDQSDSKDIGLNMRDNSGKTAFMLACGRGNTINTKNLNTLRLLLEYSESKTKNIHLNLRDNDGMTGFMIACRKNILDYYSLPNGLSSRLEEKYFDYNSLPNGCPPKFFCSYAVKLLLKHATEKNIELPFDVQEYPEIKAVPEILLSMGLLRLVKVGPNGN